MRAVSIKGLMKKLREYVRLAASGETVWITDRDRVVAELVPARPERRLLPADAFLADAVRNGWVTPAVLAGGRPPPRKPVAALKEILTDLEWSRGDR